jgi:hypothetical protein
MRACGVKAVANISILAAVFAYQSHHFLLAYF